MIGLKYLGVQINRIYTIIYAYGEDYKKERVNEMKILVINAGSSSLKYQLFDMEGEKVLAKGLCELLVIDGHL